MKILFISDNYPPYIKGGAEVSTSLLANWLYKKNNTVFVACSKFADKPWNENGIMVYPIISNPSLKSKNFILLIFHGLSVIFLQLISAVRILRLIRSIKPDIVNVVPSSYGFIPIIISIKIFSSCPIVIDCRDYSLICPAHLSPSHMGNTKIFDETVQSHHGYRCIRYTGTNSLSSFAINMFAFFESCIFNLYKSILRFLVNYFDGIKLVGVSKYVQQQLILNGFREEKTTNIYNISDSSKSSPDLESKIPIFAYGGRVEKDKGIWDLVAATEILQPELKDRFVVKIAGIGSDFNKLQSYISKNNLTCIHLLGRISPNEVLALYEQSIAIIAPSIWPEPFGRYILESISVGKPIISTRSGGTIEGVEDKITGLLIDVGNIQQLVSAMRYFVNDPEKSHIMREAIIEKRKYYTADVIGKKRLALYTNLYN